MQPSTTACDKRITVLLRQDEAVTSADQGCQKEIGPPKNVKTETSIKALQLTDKEKFRWGSLQRVKQLEEALIGQREEDGAAGMPGGAPGGTWQDEGCTPSGPGRRKEPISGRLKGHQETLKEKFDSQMKEVDKKPTQTMRFPPWRRVLHPLLQAATLP